MAGTLTDEQMDQLETWIGTGPKTFTLLYSITRDGCQGSTFHQKCDNQGPTVTVLYNPHGSVYGGYTSLSWDTSGGWKQDAKAFLYQLQFSGIKTVKKFPSKNAPNGVFLDINYGPLFGGSGDLKTFTHIVNKSGDHFPLNGNMNGFGRNYDAHGVQAGAINNGNMNVTELDVYKVADGQKPARVKTDTCPKPWRKTPALDQKYLTQLKEEVENFKPISGVDISEYRILMLGPVGSGKSSFYNTIDSIFRGRISRRAACGSEDNSTTTAFTPYSFRTKSGSALKFQLCDTPGFKETLDQDVLEYNFLLDGYIQDFHQFHQGDAITPQSRDFVQKPSLSSRAHCVVHVLDATTVDGISPILVNKIKFFRKLANQREIPQAVVLTKFDLVNKELNDKSANVFTCTKVEAIVEKVSTMFGVPRNSILPVKNYENEMHLDDSVSILALMALQQLLYSAEDYTENLTAKMKTGMTLSQHEQDVTESDTA